MTPRSPLKAPRASEALLGPQIAPRPHSSPLRASEDVYSKLDPLNGQTLEPVL